MVTNDSGIIPVEFFVVVEMPLPKEKTSGGIILPETTMDKDKISAHEGTLVAVSPCAFDYANWPEGSRKPEVGDRVLFKRHAGWLHEREIAGQKRLFRLLNDKDIAAILEPDAAPVAMAA